jgi:hypothetical protein
MVPFDNKDRPLRQAPREFARARFPEVCFWAMGLGRTAGSLLPFSRLGLDPTHTHRKRQAQISVRAVQLCPAGLLGGGCDRATALC